LSPLLARLALVGALLPVAADANAADDDPPVQRPPMAEPIYTETVTDVDGHEPGELEIELNTSELRPWRGRGGIWQASVEGELLATRHLGFRVEPTVTHSVDGAAKGSTDFMVNAGVSWKLVQDFEHDFHLQAELAGRLPTGASPDDPIQPGDATLPAAFDLRAGLRRGWLTLRGSVGAEAGGTAAHVPLRAGFGLFTGFGRSERYGVWGVELDADGARTTPLVLALNVMPNLVPLGLPGRLGLAIPWAIGVDDGRPSVGLLVRIFIESEREVAFASSPRSR
jgi:hypothetical protein